MGEGTLFSQDSRPIALFSNSDLFRPFPGSSGRFRPGNGARMALVLRSRFSTSTGRHV
jgi:hypothetical protein